MKSRSPQQYNRSPLKPVQSKGAGERSLLIGLQWKGMTESLAREYLDELNMLAQTAGAEVVGVELTRCLNPNPALLLGRGKVEELHEIIQETKTELVIFDEDLSPAQARNLEKAWDCRVIDRSGLILDIFAHRARTREAKTQVELAQLKYILTRLTRAWTHLERQQGGIGLRGPGETQIETDRRLIRDRIRHLEEDLHHIERVRSTQRAGREQMFRFALAGYTNVGKSTLMNALTHAGVYEEDLLFATLDSTTRILKIAPQYRALLTDTVGFIRKLPPGLVASFRSTLAEIRDAQCILHIVDLASPSFREQMSEVDKILKEMNLSDRPRIVVLNKLDALADDEPLRWCEREYPGSIPVSARSGTNLDELVERMKSVMSAEMIELSVEIPAQDGLRVAELQRVAEILEERHDDSHFRFRIRLPLSQAHRLGFLSATPTGE
ncbi:GTPase HflX [candidate division KSB1 bacterium]|nr:MAG: GTPase HflX [candidate division KSB1 bacterium]